MVTNPQRRTKDFMFRGLHQHILIGTASDRYAGWIGQIYSEGRYEKGITRRSHKVGDKTFNEETLPVECITEYFEHFSPPGNRLHFLPPPFRIKWKPFSEFPRP
jgi:hypothetical protein